MGLSYRPYRSVKISAGMLTVTDSKNQKNESCLVEQIMYKLIKLWICRNNTFYLIWIKFCRVIVMLA